mgnify:CR=1 FL=1
MYYLRKRNRNNVSLFDEFFNDFFNDDLVVSSNEKMKTDIIENDVNYVFNIEMAGFNKDDIKVSFNDDYLVIEATKTENKEEKDEKINYLRREISYGNYKRSFYLGSVNKDEIKANYDNGILNIVVPKSVKEETKKYISIE